jgi:hypothetical protein
MKYIMEKQALLCSVWEEVNTLGISTIRKYPGISRNNNVILGVVNKVIKKN